MDISSIKINFKEHREKIFILLVVIATIFLARKILDAQKIKLAGSQDKISNYQRRIELGREIDSLNKELNKFKNVGWETEESVTMMGKINEIASQYGIEIINFNPGSPQDNQYYLTVAMSLDVSADYFSLTKFLSAIEDLETLTKITSLQITSSTEPDSGEYGLTVKANIGIIAFIIKK